LSSVGCFAIRLPSKKLEDFDLLLPLSSLFLLLC